jgi:hypothetical protein
MNLLHTHPSASLGASIPRPYLVDLLFGLLGLQGCLGEMPSGPVGFAGGLSHLSS